VDFIVHDNRKLIERGFYCLDKAQRDRLQKQANRKDKIAEPNDEMKTRVG